jgi:hypothetical protein
LYNIITEVSITIKLVRLINIYLKEKYGNILMGEHLSDSFSTQNDVKRGGILSPLRVNFALQRDTRKV